MRIKYSLTFFVLLISCHQVFAYKTHWDGKTYATSNQAQAKWVEGFVQEISRKLKPNDLLLDVGCGTGNITAQFKNYLPKGSVLGIDPDATMIVKAKESNSKDGLSFQQSSLEAFKASQLFDVITSFSVIHWIKDKKAAAQKLHQLLKPGGLAYMLFIPQYEPNGLGWSIGQVAKNPKWPKQIQEMPTAIHLVDPKIFKEYLLEVGFEIETFEMIETNARFNSEEEFKKWMALWLKHLDFLKTEKEKSEFLKEITDMYKTHYPRSPLEKDGVFHYFEKMLKVGVKRRI